MRARNKLQPIYEASRGVALLTLQTPQCGKAGARRMGPKIMALIFFIENFTQKFWCGSVLQ